MGRQTSRLIYQGKDHKDIFFQGKYHVAMYLGNQLLWKKIQKIIPYISYDDYYREMCINTIDIDSKTIKKVARLIGTEFNDDKLARGDNAVGYMIKDTSWAFSNDGQNFVQTEQMKTSEVQSAFAGYALTKSCFLGVADAVDSFHVLSRDIETFERNGIWFGLNKVYGHLFSGFVKPELDIFIVSNGVALGDPSWGYTVADAKTLESLYFFGRSSIENSKKILGSDDKYIYAFFYDMHSIPHNQIERYDYILKKGDWIETFLDRSFYKNIISSLYDNGKFIVYCSENGRFQIYETTNFLNITKIETPRSITVKDISSEGTYTISFDSDVDGDVYLQPYCNLDNTLYFDEMGVMHDDDGCLFHTNINETGFKKIVTIYFDNHYFKESENNFCQILIFEEEDIEPPLGQ